MKLVKLIVLGSLLSVVGCSYVKTEDFNRLEARVEENQRVAEQALTRAQEAERRAQEANYRSQQAEEALNRGFKKSMYK